MSYASEFLALLEDETESAEAAVEPIKESTLTFKSKLLVNEKDFLVDKKKNESGNELTVTDLFGDVSDDDENLTQSGKDIKKELENNSGFSLGCVNGSKKKVNPWKGSTEPKAANQIEIEDPLSGIRVINPLVSSLELKNRMSGKKFIRLSQVKRHIKPKQNDIDGDWVTVGVVTSKSTQNSKTSGKVFSILKLSDLLDVTKYVSMFLFGESHSAHWKITVGTVVGLMNPEIMPPKKDGNGKFKTNANELASFTLDNSFKLLVIGDSKDMGRCKAVTKAGEICNSLVNLSVSRFCEFHITLDYKSVVSKRYELKATYSGIQPGNKNGLLQGLISAQDEQNSPAFSCALLAPSLVKSTVKAMKKTLEAEKKEEENSSKVVSGSTTPKKVLTEEEKEERKRKKSDYYMKHRLEGEMIKRAVENPITLAARNFAAITNVKTQTTNVLAKSMTKSSGINPGDFKTPSEIFSMLKPSHPKPRLGLGLKTGDVIDLVSGKTQNVLFAKRRAATLLKHKSSISKNITTQETKKRSLENIMQRVENSILQEETNETPDNEQQAKKRKLEMINKAIERKSNHEHEVGILELQNEQKYFNSLERREKIEEKIQSTTSIECNVVTCKDCSYTSTSLSEMCKKNCHKTVYHKAKKRFFKCKGCKTKTATFSQLIPTKPCHKCGLLDFEKTTMYNVKAGIKLDSEKLLIRGEETKFLNSLK
ncbi:Protein MCM10 -like protein [Halotydeus destructor]|nr:Protein MCM10 -like protein [Halotydeus destructor]